MNNDKHDEPLITEEHLEMLTGVFKQTLEKGVSFPEILMILFDSGAKIWTDLPDSYDDSTDKHEFIRKLGFDLRAKFGGIREALYIGESWMVNADTPDANRIQPSRHPARQESIVIIGRNHDKSLSALVLQLFSRDNAGLPIWSEPTIKISQDKNNITFEGILDNLFLG